MDALRRGWVGLALFLTALVLMPVLVLDYHERLSQENAESELKAESIVPSPGPTAPPPPSPDVLRGFLGVVEGATLSGMVHITLDTVQDIGPVEYLLIGPAGRYARVADEMPYLFAPHGTGWDTRQVPDGVYTLRAHPERMDVRQLSVSFIVRNNSL